MPDKKPESQSLALIPTTVHDTMEIADVYSKSALIPAAFQSSKNKQADLFLTISFGLDLGFSPAASLRAINVIRGKPGLYADAMVALVLASGKAKYFRVVDSSPDSATYETCRVGETKKATKTFTQSDAKRAGLMKGSDSGWGKYPQHMCEARAKSWLARDIYPDVLHGVYCAEELEELEPEQAKAADFAPIMAAAEVSEAATAKPKPDPAISPEPLSWDAGDEPEPAPAHLVPPEIQPDIRDEAKAKAEAEEYAACGGHPIDLVPPDDDMDAALGLDEKADPAKPTLLEQLEQAPDMLALQAAGAKCADITDGTVRDIHRAAYTKRWHELKEG